ncbi:unnamed protein product [Aphanomyces euteiches]|uniref:HIT domain-containing protein n=1 Tax=Aphanomyces euteiches TaxID=100861 RepID=A0A6G0WCB6_9STRA|nr:hypothetical protein Ae201684_016527 [Aphanomyces euteiches]KAH9092640.1 hypothetical protein Ae201684P_008310 [Aphanomyces euteiches]KAH9140614.1 hypothetical protein AeRB84_015155 [Aphanomyces euteiches]
MGKVLLSGDVGSEWATLHARIEKLHGSAHGPFDFVLCAGRCDVESNSISSWPLPVYVLADHEDNHTSTNLHVVSTNTVQDVCGLSIAFLADSNAVESFRNTVDKQLIDILVTQDYPQGFDHLIASEQVPSSIQRKGLKTVAEAAQAALPRYHIAGTHGLFYQRLPYVTNQGNNRRLTRFIGLGQVGLSTDKDKKWMHALNLDIVKPDAASVDIPPGTTQNPYESSKRQLEEASHQARKRPHTGLSAEKAQQLMQQSGNKPRHSFYDSQQHAFLPNRQECWFCLSTPTVETHLIVSIGNEAYLAIPKGAIVPDHALIIPIQHTASMQNIGAAAWKEVNQFKAALKKFYAAQGKAMIVMDRNVSTLGAAHCHLQIVPVPESILPSVAGVFYDEGTKHNVDFRELDPDEDVADAEYLLVEFPDEENKDNQRRLLHTVKGKHYMQFGRDVAATLLNAPRRGNWKYCVVPKEEEEGMTQAFKKEFAPYDFTLELE